MSYVIGFLAFIFILGAAVVIHEFGHFAVAKLLKIRVETFSVGFGPRIFGRRWGTTDYRVSAIPLGGYVKLGGDESNAAIEGEGAADIPPEEQFTLRPRWQKIAVAIAGPVMNILTALTITALGAMWMGIPAAPAPVVTAIAQGGAAEQAGVQVNDRIVAFNGVENPSWDRIYGDALLRPEKSVPLTVERNGQRVQLNIKPTKRTDSGEPVGVLDMQPDFGSWPVMIDSVQDGTPAQEAGLQHGDRILSINGEMVHDPDQVSQLIQAHKTESLTIQIARDGQTKEIKTHVRRLSDGTERLGLKTDLDTPLERVGPIAAFGYAVQRNVEVLRLTGTALGQFFSGQRSARDTISGPIGIARASSMAANELGWAGVFSMLGFLSLNLGIFNLFPIPVLDGGAIFLLLLEALLGLVGLTLSMAVRERIQQVGFVIVLLLMVLVITNDLSKEWSRHTGPDKPAATEPKK
jgi:regulator of sigma E protease